MIITKRTETYYRVEMSATQAALLELLLATGKDGHVNELSVTKDEKLADDLREAISAFRYALENRFEAPILR